MRKYLMTVFKVSTQSTLYSVHSCEHRSPLWMYGIMMLDGRYAAFDHHLENCLDQLLCHTVVTYGSCTLPMREDMNPICA